jgi:hypothetical protein
MPTARQNRDSAACGSFGCGLLAAVTLVVIHQSVGRAVVRGHCIRCGKRRQYAIGEALAQLPRPMMTGMWASSAAVRKCWSIASAVVHRECILPVREKRTRTAVFVIASAVLAAAARAGGDAGCHARAGARVYRRGAATHAGVDARACARCDPAVVGCSVGLLGSMDPLALRRNGSERAWISSRGSAALSAGEDRARGGRTGGNAPCRLPAATGRAPSR